MFAGLSIQLVALAKGVSGRLCLCFSMTIWLVVALSGQLPFLFWGDLHKALGKFNNEYKRLS